MKKRLFISSILMTLVLLVAITTATFAWYQAALSAGIAQDSATSASLTTMQSHVENGVSVGHLLATDGAIVGQMCC